MLMVRLFYTEIDFLLAAQNRNTEVIFLTKEFPLVAFHRSRRKQQVVSLQLKS